jgi:hypothetical protein
VHDIALHVAVTVAVAAAPPSASPLLFDAESVPPSDSGGGDADAAASGAEDVATEADGDGDGSPRPASRLGVAVRDAKPRGGGVADHDGTVNSSSSLTVSSRSNDRSSDATPSWCTSHASTLLPATNASVLILVVAYCDSAGAMMGASASVLGRIAVGASGMLLRSTSTPLT